MSNRDATVSVCPECGSAHGAVPRPIMHEWVTLIAFSALVVFALVLVSTVFGRIVNPPFMPKATEFTPRVLGAGLTMGDLRRIARGEQEPGFVPRDLLAAPAWFGPLWWGFEDSALVEVHVLDRVDRSEEDTIALGWPVGFLERRRYRYVSGNSIPVPERSGWLPVDAQAAISTRTLSYSGGDGSSGAIDLRLNFWILVWAVPACCGVWLILNWFTERTGVRRDNPAKGGPWRTRWVTAAALLLVGIFLLTPVRRETSMVTWRTPLPEGDTFGLTYGEVRALPPDASGARVIASRIVDAIDRGIGLPEGATPVGVTRFEDLILTGKTPVDVTPGPVPDRAALVLSAANMSANPETHVSWGWFETPTIAYRTVRIDPSDPASAWGVRYENLWLDIMWHAGGERRMWSILVPRLLMVLGLALALPVMVAWARTVYVRARTRRRIARGMCAVCAYDLTSVPKSFRTMSPAN